jgi:hypothetical protein
MPSARSVAEAAPTALLLWIPQDGGKGYTVAESFRQRGPAKGRGGHGMLNADASKMRQGL